MSWENIPSIHTKYEISKTGEVRKNEDGCITKIKPYMTKSGLRFACRMPDGRETSRNVALSVYSAYIREVPASEVVCFTNGNITDIRLDNLYTRKREMGKKGKRDLQSILNYIQRGLSYQLLIISSYRANLTRKYQIGLIKSLFRNLTVAKYKQGYTVYKGDTEILTVVETDDMGFNEFMKEIVGIILCHLDIDEDKAAFISAGGGIQVIEREPSFTGEY